MVRIAKLFTGRGKVQGAVCIKGGKPCHIFSLEFIPQNRRGDKKVTGGLSDFPVLCKTAAGNNTVHVHMVIQFLVPGVKHLDDTGRGAEPFFIRR